jgi:hypothetical protein
LLPFSLLFLGYAAAHIKISEQRIANIFLSITLIVSIYGIYELYFLDFSFFYKYLNVGGFYFEIKGLDSICLPFHCGTVESKPEFAFLGAERRLSGIFLEPLTTGIYLSSGLALFIYLHSFKTHFKNIIILICIAPILFYATLLTQSRSALIAFFIILIPALLSTHTKKTGLLIFYSVFFLTLITTGLHSYFEHSVHTLGGVGGHKEDLEDFFKILFKLEYFMGKGVGFTPIQHSGYAQIYTQFGYLGLVICIFFLGIIIFKLSRFYKLCDPLILFSLGAIIATAVIFNFSSYAFSFKGYFIIWFTLGYSIYKLETKRIVVKQTFG